MINTRNLLVTGAVLASLAFLAARPSLADEADSRACADQLMENARAEGYRLRMLDTDTLVKQGELGYNTIFTGGHEYIIFACGDSAARDLDIYLYDEAGKLVMHDKGSDGMPIVAVTPEYTGTYLMVVKLYASDGDGSFTLAVMYQ